MAFIFIILIYNAFILVTILKSYTHFLHNWPYMCVKNEGVEVCGVQFSPSFYFLSF